jgi:hypothetical protein
VGKVAGFSTLKSNMSLKYITQNILRPNPYPTLRISSWDYEDLFIHLYFIPNVQRLKLAPINAVSDKYITV